MNILVPAILGVAVGMFVVWVLGLGRRVDAMLDELERDGRYSKAAALLPVITPLHGWRLPALLP